MTLYYLATPYSKYETGLESAFKMACYQAALLLKSGYAVFSPIAHSHPIAMQGGIDPFDHAVWLHADRPLMDAADAIVVVTAPGWRDSYGVAYEIETFRRANKPVIYMASGEVPDAAEMRV